MIIVYVRDENRVSERILSVGDPLPPKAVWIDLLQPNLEERMHLASLLDVDLPTVEEMKEIEASSQLYVERGSIYVTAPVIWRAETPHPEQGELTFILTARHLVTVRYTEPRSFAAFSNKLQKQPELVATAEDALLGLLDAMIARLADVLELVAARIDRLSTRIFESDNEEGDDQRSKRKSAGVKSQTLNETLAGIGRAGDLNHKMRAVLAGLDRLLAFLGPVTVSRLNKEQKATLKTLSRDLRSLNQHAAFLGQEVNFLLEATLGLISIEQSNIIKIFSVAAVAFLPPTLIASIYGMNFQHMPELDWPFAYPIALVLMVLSGVLPVLYFKRKGWL